MDSFEGSEPRFFISFRLDDETNGQTAQESAEAMDTSPITMPNTDQQSPSSDWEIEVVEITSTSPDRPNTPITPVPQETQAQEPVPPTNLLFAQIYKKGGFSFSSSGSDESCTTYFTKKMEALEAMKIEPADDPPQPFQKQSESKNVLSDLRSILPQQLLGPVVKVPPSNW